LLEREGALKVLAAVQAAAENEMAFEQRAAVAKNLLNFVLRHRRSFKFYVSSFKFSFNAFNAEARRMRRGAKMKLFSANLCGLCASAFIFVRFLLASEF
jgi:hypothetical protein